MSMCVNAAIDLYMHTHLFVAVQCDSGRWSHCYWRGSWFSDFRTYIW